MRHNLTLLEIGWLCPALLSILRSSPQQIHSDQNSQILLRLLNESAECKWPPTDGQQLNTLVERVMRHSNPIQRVQLGKKLGQIGSGEQKKGQQILNEEKRIKEKEEEEEEEDDPRVIWSMTAVYTAMTLVGIVGNILVVVVVQTVPGMVCYNGSNLMKIYF
jgi:hypothetical protein